MADPRPRGRAGRPQQRTALVTGASAGIGREFARQLAATGYRVIAVARDPDRLRLLTDELGPDHEHLAADLATALGRQQVADVLANQRVHLLVNNAGTAVTGAFAAVPLPRTLAMMHLNCEALVTLAHLFLSQAEPGDALLNVSSTLAFAPVPNLSVYSATKAFVTSFSESLWYEHKDRGVYVMGLCPGMTATESQPHTGEDVPAGLVQTPEQVVAAALTALRHRKRPTVISGRKNALFATAARNLPRRVVLSMLGNDRKPSHEAHLH
ncbi:SDR family NAD(P)-dependent oxidoreductase [Streptomyces sp. NBC_00879]|uniref:SDR family NAD(P)-dependent oxidoreductase n=1 Tax=Streptomyces sp. NBC_00879 TaxID=2975855 RepID=UPI00386ABFC5|nr:SDR family NAD(P)-dependent oxidoreductase [Streptomyces sp. NBC_00879]